MIYLDNRVVDIQVFPNGESRIDCTQFNKCGVFHHIHCSFNDNSDLIHLMLIKKYCDEMNWKTRLTIPYFPYERMDRTNDIYVFTLKYVCQFINDMNFAEVLILEPHSDVVTALLNRCTVINATEILLENESNTRDMSTCIICAPDAGAFKRYAKVIEKYNSCWCNKHRDFATGKITHMEIMGNIGNATSAIIIDDLCSYGNTFIMAGKTLKEKGIKNVTLIITHCEKSILKGDIPTSPYIDRVIASDTIISKEDLIGIDKIEVRKVINND